MELFDSIEGKVQYCYQGHIFTKTQVIMCFIIYDVENNIAPLASSITFYESINSSLDWVYDVENSIALLASSITVFEYSIILLDCIMILFSVMWPEIYQSAFNMTVVK